MQLQEFYKHTLGTTFLKSLLYNSEIPMISTASSGDYLIKDGIYIIENYIVKCTESGYYLPSLDKLNVVGNMRVGDILSGDYDSEPTRCALDKLQFYTFGDKVLNVTKRYVSNSDSYDSHTHKYVGDYLRAVRDLYRIDLMGLYNCFDYDSTEYLYLDETKGVVEGVFPKSKVLLIPIKFNKTYTIAIDCEFPVLVKAVFCKDGMLLKDEDDNSFTDLLPESIRRYNGIRFSNPVTYMISNDTSADLYMPDNDGSDFNIEDAEQAAFVKKTEVDRTLQEHEKYLYLAVQIPKTNTSSVSVIEGDFSSVANRYVSSAEGINKLSDRQLSRTFISKLSLLQSNSGKQIPYSDKLIAYLLQYTIDSRDEINENISGIETKIDYRPALPDFVKGIWDVDLRYTLYSKYMNISGIDYIDKKDILGFVDRDIENAVNKGLIKHVV